MGSDGGWRFVTNDKISLLAATQLLDTIPSMKTPKQLSREAIEEFRIAYAKEFGRMLSDDEVQEIAMQLLRFFGILAKPI